MLWEETSDAEQLSKGTAKAEYFSFSRRHWRALKKKKLLIDPHAQDSGNILVSWANLKGAVPGPPCWPLGHSQQLGTSGLAWAGLYRRTEFIRNAPHAFFAMRLGAHSMYVHVCFSSWEWNIIDLTIFSFWQIFRFFLIQWPPNPNSHLNLQFPETWAFSYVFIIYLHFIVCESPTYLAHFFFF